MLAIMRWTVPGISHPMCKEVFLYIDSAVTLLYFVCMAKSSFFVLRGKSRDLLSNRTYNQIGSDKDIQDLM